MKMRQSQTQFESAFEQQKVLEQRRREQLRHRAANRSRAGDPCIGPALPDPGADLVELGA